MVFVLGVHPVQLFPIVQPENRLMFSTRNEPFVIFHRQNSVRRQNRVVGRRPSVREDILRVNQIFDGDFFRLDGNVAANGFKTRAQLGQIAFDRRQLLKDKEEKTIRENLETKNYLLRNFSDFLQRGDLILQENEFRSLMFFENVDAMR